MPLYAVINQRGDNFKRGLPLEQQLEWETHAAFMDALVDDGFVVLGGPLEGSDEVLLIVRASSPDEIRDRLQHDPWHQNGLLHISRVLPWTLRLGSLPK
jgi:uncharacterized protein YciI